MSALERTVDKDESITIIDCDKTPGSMAVMDGDDTIGFVPPRFVEVISKQAVKEYIEIETPLMKRDYWRKQECKRVLDAVWSGWCASPDDRPTKRIQDHAEEYNRCNDLLEKIIDAERVT